jgi:DNA mismatch repair protein MutL
MNKVKVLPKETAELIAAGEVIERPASVAKELIENAVDAGASKITVEIRGGGIAYLRVTDDGCGIAFEDVPTAFLRHATSKIITGADLNNIMTLGFRGEALASVCAVSKTELFTKEQGAEFGTHYSVSGTEPIVYERTGCPTGTSIIVRDLFYNVPARLKFLRKDVSEGNAVSGIVQKIAMSHPEIAFSFIRDNRRELQTAGDGDFFACIYAVLGKQFAASLIPADLRYNSIRVSGFISRPLFAKANRAFQHFFVNGRYIRSFICMNAIEEGYKNTVMTGKFPACVLYLTIPPAIMDVNAHPAKLEVKFSEEKLIYDSVFFTVKNALLSDNLPGELEAVTPKASEQAFEQVFEKAFVKVSEKSIEITKSYDNTFRYINESAFTLKEQAPVPPLTETAETVLPSPDERMPDNVTLLGEAFSTYIICETDSDLYMIDKHAAHERILYNNLKSGAEPLMCQYMLTETTFTADTELLSAADEHCEDLTALGFDFSVSDDIITLRGLPSILDDNDSESVFCEILQNISEHKNNPLPEIIDNLYHTIACKAAIKGNTFTGAEEQLRLAKRVLSDDNVRYCPHGRPVIFKISERELEKHFKRIQ